MEVMKSLLMQLYPLACAYVPCMIYQFIIVRKKGLKGKIPIKHFIWTYIFILYLYMALDVAGIGCVWDIGRFGPVLRPDEINLVPFQSEGYLTYILNVIMFLPLGFLLPLIWKEYRTIVNVILAGAGFTAAIEIGQLFNRRKTDIDDLIMNVLGAVAGYIIWRIFHKLFVKKIKAPVSLSSKEAAVYLTLSVLGLFLLYDWRLLVHLFYAG